MSKVYKKLEILFLLIFLLYLNSCSFAAKKEGIEHDATYVNLLDSIRIKESKKSENLRDSLYLEIDLLLEHQALLYQELDSLHEELDNFKSMEQVNRNFQIPNSIMFAGYKIDLRNDRIYHRFKEIFDNELKTAHRYIPVSGSYFAHFEEIFSKYGVPEDLKYLAIAESQLKSIATSFAGASGIWQFMPQTAKGYGMKINSYIDERRNIYKSTEAAARYLRDIYRILLEQGIDDWLLAMCSYNAGVGNVLKDAKKQGGKTFFDIIMRVEETNKYVWRSVAIKLIFQNQKKIFGKNFTPDIPFDANTRLERIELKGFHKLESWAKAQGTNISKIWRLNPWIKISKQKRNKYTPINKVILPPGNYDLLVPSQSIPDQEALASVTKKYLEKTVYDISYYKVRRGDNLSTIARRFNTSISKLKSINNLRGNNIYIGQKLKIRAEIQTGGDIYVVQRGDNLGVIAQKHGLSLRSLKKMNQLSGNNIYPGQKLVVSTAKARVSSKKRVRKQNTNIPNYGNIGSHSYIVQPGDNLYDIAKSFSMTVTQIKDINNLRNNVIRPGQKLLVNKKNFEYVVKKGDNLSGISQKMGVSFRDLKKWNNLHNNTLVIGQKLKIIK